MELTTHTYQSRLDLLKIVGRPHAFHEPLSPAPAICMGRSSGRALVPVHTAAIMKKEGFYYHIGFDDGGGDNLIVVVVGMILLKMIILNKLRYLS